MSKFIKNIGNCRWNGIGVDLYENKDGSARINFDKNGRNLPKRTQLKFKSTDAASEFIERKKGSNGVNTIINIIEYAGI